MLTSCPLHQARRSRRRGQCDRGHNLPRRARARRRADRPRSGSQSRSPDLLSLTLHPLALADADHVLPLALRTANPHPRPRAVPEACAHRADRGDARWAGPVITCCAEVGHGEKLRCAGFQPRFKSRQRRRSRRTWRLYLIDMLVEVSIKALQLEVLQGAIACRSPSRNPRPLTPVEEERGALADGSSIDEVDDVRWRFSSERRGAGPLRARPILCFAWTGTGII